MLSAPLGVSREEQALNEIAVIGWAFAALAAVGGVVFLVKMAYWQPDKKRRRRGVH